MYLTQPEHSMNFILNRDKTIVSLHGHAIAFKKGIPTHVPPAMYAEVQQIGAIPEDELEETVTVAPKEPDDPIKRKALIYEAFAALVLGAKRESFTGTGAPHAKALAAQLGFIVDSKERDKLWADFNAEG